MDDEMIIVSNNTSTAIHGDHIMVEVSTPNQNANTKPAQPVKPLPTDVKELYAEFEKSLATSSARGVKAKKIRGFIEEVVKVLGKDRVNLSAVHKVINTKHPDEKVDRSHFNNIVNSAWEVEKDENGTVWILINKPKPVKN